MFAERTAIIFDVDDTLYLERDYVRSGFDAVGAWVEQQAGAAGFGATCWSLFVAGARGDIFDRALGEHGLTSQAALLRGCVECYREHEPHIRLGDAEAAVLKAVQQSHDLAVLTGGPLPSQQKKVAALGLDRWADVIVYAGIWGPRYDKPHPRAWLEVERLLGVSGERCVYVADNPAKDFEAPVQRGWLCVRVRLPGSLHEAVGTPDDIEEIRSLTNLSLAR